MKKSFDPLEYIQKGFLDQAAAPAAGSTDAKPKLPRGNFTKTEMRAPRPRRKSNVVVANAIDPELQAIWLNLPKSLQLLASLYDDKVTANYYQGEFKETRQELIKRMLDPQLSLEEVSRLLGVCPTTVRRYTNKGWLAHHRTKGDQRRFLLSDLVKFVEQHGRVPK
ncbi:MAG TPA: helix-turn-helix domain-containing protein [Fimbriimonas sp.]|nr:helix-turn-helix domain-containing protein [Fimbriimonas sp.]